MYETPEAFFVAQLPDTALGKILGFRYQQVLSWTSGSRYSRVLAFNMLS